MKMLKHDIADKKFLEIIEKFLKAGIMENGKYRIELAKKKDQNIGVWEVCQTEQGKNG